jgi:hypothetical protein
VDSSVVGYDVARNVRDKEDSVGRKKLVRKAEPPSQRRIRDLEWTGFRGKTVWDWLELLLIPGLVVIFGTLLTTFQQDVRQVKIEEARLQDAALQAYLAQMSEVLLLENSLRAPGADNEEVRALARARTLMILRTVDPSLKTRVMNFLLEANLVQATDGRTPTIRLSGANLREVHMVDTNLSNVQLVNADLRRADLRGADLRGADLRGADLEGSNGITGEELEQQAASLEGATMPNGQKYEYWRKDR